MSASDIIGGFRRIKEVGSGAQAKVWKAKCVQDIHGIVPKGAIVALKIKSGQGAESDEQYERLRNRIEDLKAMEHPNIVRYLGCFRDCTAEHDRHVIVQEYLEGETLKKRLANRRIGLDVDEGLRIIREAADGLKYAAGLRIFHRDIKPGNIFFCEDGSVKLIDFGVAKQEGETVDGGSNFRGTFDYMAPDFMSPAFNGDEQSDIFSLGVVLHEIIAGKRPYIDGSGSNWQGWMSRWREWNAGSEKAESPIYIHAMTLRLLKGAYEVIEKALAPNRAKRYESFAAFREGLDTIGFFEQKHGERTYRRLQFVGKGGFGAVFKARWLERGVDVAIKQLLNAEYAGRFRTEAKVMRALDDPCFVKFIDFFETGEHAFLVMQFLEGMPGSSLRDAINRTGKQGLPKGLVFSAFERYARGLSELHRRKVIHRDIKPSNLYYPAGRPDLVAIMDFGIVKAEDSSFTSGMVPCTFDYAPPEIAVTSDRGGPGMDIYALGLCMYEALTGRYAYSRIPTGTSGFMAFFERCKSKREPTFDDPRVAGDPELLALLRKMTAPEIADRYTDADEVAVEIRKLFYRKSDDDECPPTQVFDPDTDKTVPIDEKRLMEWYNAWVKAHPEAQETPAVAESVATEAGRARQWWKHALVAILSAGVAVGGVVVVEKLWGKKEEPAPAHGVITNSVPDQIIEKENELLKLRRRIFESEFDKAIADEPVETRRARLFDISERLEKAHADGLYHVDDEKWNEFEGKLKAACSAVVGKIRNDCRCELQVDDATLAAGETRLIKFTDGTCSNHTLKILGYEPRAVPNNLDGKTIAISRKDFKVLPVEVTIPELPEGAVCQIDGKECSATVQLLPGKHTGEFSRTDYKSVSKSFNVAPGVPMTAPAPKENEWHRITPVQPSPDLKAIEEERKKMEEIQRQLEEQKRQLEEQKRQNFEQKLAKAIDDEPIMNRRKRLAEGAKLMEDARKEGFYKEDTARLDKFEAELKAASSAVVGKIKNACGCELQVDDATLAVGETAPIKFADGKCADHTLRILGYEPRAVPDDLDGKMITISRKDFKVLPVEVTIPELPEGAVCRIDGKECSARVQLLPGKHTGEFSRTDYKSVTKSFNVAPGVPMTAPAPKDDEWQRVGPDPKVLALQRQLEEQKRQNFEQKFAKAIDDEPVEDRRKRLAEGAKLMEDARKEGFYKEDTARLDKFEAELKAASSAIVGKIKNVCGCELQVDDATLAVGETAPIKFADGKCADHTLRILGYEPRAVPDDLDGKTITISRKDFKVLPVEVTIPELPEGAVCRIDGKECSARVQLLPGDHLGEFARSGFISVTNAFKVLPGAPVRLKDPEWREIPLQPKPLLPAEEIEKLVKDARDYHGFGSPEKAVETFYEAFVKGYRLNADDMKIFEESYKNHHEFLQGEISRLEKQEYRIGQNLREIANYRKELAQLVEWYLAVKNSR